MYIKKENHTSPGVDKKELCENQYEIRIKAPYVVKNAKAGQFVILRPLKDSERII